MEGIQGRSNRGTRIQDLLASAVPEDDFYAALEDESDDDEWGDLSDGEDVVDSDFDIDEGEYNEEEEAKKAEQAARAKEKTGTRGKAVTYVDPAKAAKKKSSASTRNSSSADFSPDSPRAMRSRKRAVEGSVTRPKKLRKSSRTLSVQSSKQLAQKQIQEESERRKRPTPTRKKPPPRQLTQDELLEEAKKTEKLNLASLQLLMLIEEETKKKRKQKKVTAIGPRVTLLSRPTGDFVTFSDHIPSYLTSKLEGTALEQTPTADLPLPFARHEAVSPMSKEVARFAASPQQSQVQVQSPQQERAGSTSSGSSPSQAKSPSPTARPPPALQKTMENFFKPAAPR